jgi:hypothetical protein
VIVLCDVQVLQTSLMQAWRDPLLEWSASLSSCREKWLNDFLSQSPRNLYSQLIRRSVLQSLPRTKEPKVSPGWRKPNIPRILCITLNSSNWLAKRQLRHFLSRSHSSCCQCLGNSNIHLLCEFTRVWCMLRICRMHDTPSLVSLYSQAGYMARICLRFKNFL